MTHTRLEQSNEENSNPQTNPSEEQSKPLIKPYVPNDVFEVYVKAGASLFLVSSMNSLIGCSDAVTYLGVALGLYQAAMGIQKNGYDNTLAYTAEGFQSLNSGLTSTAKAIKEYEWKNKYTEVSTNVSSFFGALRANTIGPAKQDVRNDNYMKMKKTM